MDYLQHNHFSLRAADYTPLCKQLGYLGITEIEVDAVWSSHLNILPSTYVCGDRCMGQIMQNIISISINIYFLGTFQTMTCNTQWPEVKKAFTHRQSVTGRPSTAPSVLSIKLCAMMAFVMNEKVFQETKAHVRVIKFQKRWLPHPQCNPFIAPASKVNLLNPTFLDIFIAAESLDQQHSLWRQIDQKHNMHNSCGHFRFYTVCTIDDICPKQFPNVLVDETGQDEAQMYVTCRCKYLNFEGKTAPCIYRAPESPATGWTDNSWVVSLSPKISITFHCQINVELFVSRIGRI